MSARRPVLWHIPISHFSEKARWALAWKGVEHERRAPLPGAHIAVALWLTRGRAKTFPVLELEGRRIGDSTAIIAALEQRFPDPPLYPADLAERRRALELEDYFDEELGPAIRLLAWHELRRDHERMAELGAGMLPGPLRGSDIARAAAGRFGSAYVQARFRVASDEAAAAARERVRTAFDRLDAELAAGDGRHLVGERFTVADLTAAALFYPLALPPEGPALPSPPAGFEAFRAAFSERPALAWIERTFRDYRRPGG